MESKKENLVKEEFDTDYIGLSILGDDIQDFNEECLFPEEYL